MQNNALELRDIATNDLILSLDPGSVSFSFDDRYLATRSDRDNILRILEISTKKVIFQQSIESLSNNLKIIGDSAVTNMSLENVRKDLFLSTFSVSKDGNIHFYRSNGWSAFLWIVNKNQIEVIGGLKGKVQETSLSQLGSYLATSDRYNGIQIIETNSGNRVMELQNDGGGSSGYGGDSGLAFSPDEKYIAIISLENVVRIFEVSTGQEIQRLEVGSRATLEYPGRRIRVSRLAFSPDGQNLATEFILEEDSSEKKQPAGILLWDLQTKSIVSEMCSRLTRNFLFSEWKQVFGEAPYQKTCPNLSLPQDLPKSSSDSSKPDEAAETNSIPDSSQVPTPLHASPNFLPFNAFSTPSPQSQEPTPSTSSKIVEKPQSFKSPILDEPERVAFDKEGTETSVQGRITANQIKQYLLWCKNGQRMTIQIKEGDLKVTVIAPDGQIIGTANTTKQWEEQLPSNGDYTVKISSPTGSNYTVRIKIL
ncbi:WD40 repeat domain-containing protein [Phormidesmis sp. 146-33]